VKTRLTLLTISLPLEQQHSSPSIAVISRHLFYDVLNGKCKVKSVKISQASHLPDTWESSDDSFFEVSVLDAAGDDLNMKTANSVPPSTIWKIFVMLFSSLSIK